MTTTPLDFSGLRSVEAFGWRENAAIWRTIEVSAWNAKDWARLCYAQKIAQRCESFAEDVERHRESITGQAMVAGVGR